MTRWLRRIALTITIAAAGILGAYTTTGPTKASAACSITTNAGCTSPLWVADPVLINRGGGIYVYCYYGHCHTGYYVPWGYMCFYDRWCMPATTINRGTTVCLVPGPCAVRYG